jgi:putative glutamine amidotransferase
MNASTSAPLIGIVATHKDAPFAEHPDNPRTFVGLYRSYIDCLTAAGALPVLVPPDLPQPTLRALYERLDGLLLAGGGDIDPPIYGVHSYNETVRGIIAARDTAELTLTRWAVADDVPLLGICRGHQVLNVALGGTLYTDIPSAIGTDVLHDGDENTAFNHFTHRVQIAPESKLAGILAEDSAVTNSRPHQALRDLGDGLVATAHTSDGIIEATEAPDRHFVLSVQWHPENMTDDPAMRRLFNALSEAAHAHREQVVARH